MATRLGVPVTFLTHPKLSWAVAPSRLAPGPGSAPTPWGGVPISIMGSALWPQALQTERQGLREAQRLSKSSARGG